jgi:aspartate carbamoyltransferase regulatory subunit
MKEQKISAIREGTVIDHIPSDSTFKVAEILDLKAHDNVVSVAANLQSQKMGKKGIIKIGGRNLTKDEVNKIALLAPHASVSLIKGFEIVKKFKLNLDDEVHKIIECNNPKCITNMEDADTKFSVVSEDPLRVRCKYCERIMEKDDINMR